MSVVALLFGGVCIATSQVSGCSRSSRVPAAAHARPGGAGLLSGNTLPFWFRRRLGTVEGIRHFGMAGAIAVVPAINLALIGAFGWRTAWVILGVAVWAMMLPAMLLFRNRPRTWARHRRREDDAGPGRAAEQDQATPSPSTRPGGPARSGSSSP